MARCRHFGSVCSNHLFWICHQKWDQDPDERQDKKYDLRDDWRSDNQRIAIDVHMSPFQLKQEILLSFVTSLIDLLGLPAFVYSKR